MPPELQMNRPGGEPPHGLRTWSARAFLNEDGLLRPIFRVVMFVFSVVVLNELIGRLVFGFTRNTSLWAQLFWGSLTLTVVFLLLSWLFVRLVDGCEFSSMGLALRGGWARQLSFGFGVGVALQFLVLAILMSTGAVHYSRGEGYDFHFWHGVCASALLFVFAATVEELSFRGYAFQSLMKSVGTVGAFAVSAIIFGLAHRANPSSTFFSTVNTALAGILLALPYVRTGSMWMQIGLHWSWNFALATIVSLPVSGIRFGPHLFVVQDAGPAWLTGGNYGPEGGAAVTVVSLIAIVWLARTRLLTPSPAEPEGLQ